MTMCETIKYEDSATTHFYIGIFIFLECFDWYLEKI